MLQKALKKVVGEKISKKHSDVHVSSVDAAPEVLDLAVDGEQMTRHLRLKLRVAVHLGVYLSLQDLALATFLFKLVSMLLFDFINDGQPLKLLL